MTGDRHDSIDKPALAINKTAGQTPGILFCGGFKSSMAGSKAVALEQFALARGWAFTRFDYRGHGVSPGRFEEGTLSDWLDDTLQVLDGLTGPQIIIGSSMGAWIALLATLRRPDRITGLLLLAAATDFLIELICERLDDAQRQTLREQGRILLPSDYDDQSPYPISRALLDDSLRHRLLDKPLAIDCPVRLIHGLRDADIPWQTSARTLECLTGKDARMLLLKNADHRLSDEASLTIVKKTLLELREPYDG
ncbi:MAG: alpha/beta hydrolase [Gammaproteobacteria bacterium]|nr:alpha/beta hydrolase [Gammaproteobacteria bacterium]